MSDIGGRYAGVLCLQFFFLSSNLVTEHSRSLLISQWGVWPLRSGRLSHLDCIERRLHMLGNTFGSSAWVAEGWSCARIMKRRVAVIISPSQTSVEAISLFWWYFSWLEVMRCSLELSSSTCHTVSSKVIWLMCLPQGRLDSQGMLQWRWFPRWSSDVFVQVWAGVLGRKLDLMRSDWWDVMLLLIELLLESNVVTVECVLVQLVSAEDVRKSLRWDCLCWNFRCTCSEGILISVNRGIRRNASLLLFKVIDRWCGIPLHLKSVKYGFFVVLCFVIQLGVEKVGQSLVLVFKVCNNLFLEVEFL